MKAKAHANKQLPFSIDRTSSTSLTDQLVTGLASAIRCAVEGATGFIRMSNSSVIADFAAHCAAAGIRKVMEVVMPNGPTVADAVPR